MDCRRERSIFWAWPLVKQLPRMLGRGVWVLRNKAESSGLTPVAVGLAFRGLIRRGFVKTEQVEDRDGEYDGAYVSDEGWRWIEEHDHLFNLGSRSKIRVADVDDDFEDDIPI